MEYDSVPVLNKLLAEEKRIVSILNKQRESAARMPYPKHSEAKIDNSHLNGRRSGVEYAIGIILDRWEADNGTGQIEPSTLEWASTHKD